MGRGSDFHEVANGKNMPVQFNDVSEDGSIRTSADEQDDSTDGEAA